MDGRLLGLVREAVVRRYGHAMWDSLLAAGDPDPGVASEGPSPKDVPSDSLICWLGRESVPALQETYPSLFARHRDLASFVHGLGDELPVAGERNDAEGVHAAFGFATVQDGDTLLRLEAPTPICSLIKGVIAGAAVHYGEQVEMDELKCRKRGDNHCILKIRFAGLRTAPSFGADEGGLLAAGGR